MPSHIEIRLLRTFAAAVHHGSMAGAASALHLTQGAVSQQIKRLEMFLDQRLLERENRGVKLTIHGVRLLRHAEEMVERNDRFIADARPGDQAAPVRVGMPSDLIARYMPPIYTRLAAAEPDMELSVRSGTSPELAAMLRSGDVDLAVLEAPENAAGSHWLATESLVWVGAPSGDVHTRRPLRLSFVSQGCIFRSAVLDVLRAYRIPWENRFEDGNLEATTAAAASGVAIGVCLESVVPPQLRILPPEAGLPALPRFAISLHRAPDSQSTAIDLVADSIRRVIRAT